MFDDYPFYTPITTCIVNDKCSGYFQKKSINLVLKTCSISFSSLTGWYLLVFTCNTLKKVVCLKVTGPFQTHLGVFILEYISSIFSGSRPHRHTNPALSPLIATETSETEITTTEIIKRRDVGPYGIRSEYCIRKIICPLGVPDTPKG